MTKQNNSKDVSAPGLKKFRENLQKKEVLLQRIEQINAESKTIFVDLIKKREEIKNTRDAFENYLSQLKQIHNINESKKLEEKDIDEAEQKEVAEYKEQLISLNNDLSGIESAQEKLENKKNTLQSQIAYFQSEMEPSDVLAFQDEVTQSRKKLGDIMALIRDKETLLAEASATPPILEKLQEEREDILAEMAAGKMMENAFNEVTRKIEEESLNLSTREKMVPELKQTLSGLNRKLEVANKEVADLEGQKREVLRQFLRCEAERIAKEYGVLALSLVDKYHSLVALDEFLVRNGGMSIKGTMNHDFSIPGFRLKAFENLVSDKWPGVITKAVIAFSRDNIKAAVLREEKRITELGINL